MSNRPSFNKPSLIVSIVSRWDFETLDEEVVQNVRHMFPFKSFLEEELLGFGTDTCCTGCNTESMFNAVARQTKAAGADLMPLILPLEKH